MNEIIQAIAVYALPVIFAITLHEAAHAYAAKYFGDDTAFAQGRMSLNPMRHIDPFGTLVLPALLYITSKSLGYPMLLGYAKPVPVDYSRLRNPKKQMAFVALAGPMANFIMALGWIIFALLLSKLQVTELYPFKVAQAGILTNCVMFVFNLLPIPPLDGSRVVYALLPNRLAAQYAKIEPYGMFIVLGLLVLQLLNYWFVPMMALTQMLLRWTAFPFRLLLG
ncbi:site-2 protease family protein [Massilia sp. DWR3-1-1]|uniref:site-2 protease family protein n=1 Tax=Massilia sp. DWR3-1-1 TaxID=2804559 RepID=UPI003CEFD1B4